MSELSDYIKMEISKGYNPSNIVQVLVERGYKKDEVRQLISQYSAQEKKYFFEIKYPENFLFYLKMITVILGIISILLIIFNYGLGWFAFKSTILLSSIIINSKICRVVIKKIFQFNIDEKMLLETFFLFGLILLFFINFFNAILLLIIILIICLLVYFLKHKLNLSLKKSFKIGLIISITIFISSYILIFMFSLMMGILDGVGII